MKHCGFKDSSQPLHAEAGGPQDRKLEGGSAPPSNRRLSCRAMPCQKHFASPNSRRPDRLFFTAERSLHNQGARFAFALDQPNSESESSSGTEPDKEDLPSLCIPCKAALGARTDEALRPGACLVYKLSCLTFCQRKACKAFFARSERYLAHMRCTWVLLFNGPGVAPHPGGQKQVRVIRRCAMYLRCPNCVPQPFPLHLGVVSLHDGKRRSRHSQRRVRATTELLPHT